MDLWKIFGFGTLRLCCNWDYDKLRDIANNHRVLRLMLGLNPYNIALFALQTLKDNISLFTPEILDKINQLIVNKGHEIFNLKSDDIIKGHCDSSVVKTDVHFPTDINVLLDAMRKIIFLIRTLCKSIDIPGWRKGNSNFTKLIKLYKEAQKLSQSYRRITKNNKKKKQNKQNKQNKQKKNKLNKKKIMWQEAHSKYIEFAEKIVSKAKETIAIINELTDTDFVVTLRIMEIERYIVHAERQIDQIRRRVIQGEDIPHKGKVFSVFEEHTEWINKGKAGDIIELGLNICIVRDQFGFILHHIVMEQTQDKEIALPIVKETKSRFPQFNSCSFDKGFHTPENQIDLRRELDQVVLPKKGKLSTKDKAIEYSDEFKEERRKHSIVESSISALKNHGLERCPDHGIHGFKRYVALGVVARNIQILGHFIQQRDKEKLNKKKAA